MVSMSSVVHMLDMTVHHKPNLPHTLHLSLSKCKFTFFMHMDMVGSITLVISCLVPHVSLATAVMEPSQVLMTRRPVMMTFS